MSMRGEGGLQSLELLDWSVTLLSALLGNYMRLRVSLYRRTIGLVILWRKGIGKVLRMRWRLDIA